MGAERPTFAIDIWSDVVCPWCYIGKRRFERAVAETADEIDVVTRYHAFQLDPNAPPGASQAVLDVYSRKFGGTERAHQLIENVTRIAAGEGLGFRLDRARRANTLLAHRLLVLAGSPSLEVPQAALKERLMKAYFTDGLDIGDPDTLADCAADIGADPDTVRSLLDRDAGAAEVEADLRQASELGITAVPTFVIDGQWSIPGAQDTTTFVDILRRMAARRGAA